MTTTPTGATRLFPIIGDPIKYVESPTRLTRTLEERDYDGICVPMQVVDNDLDTVMAGLSASRNVDGILVTMPHKFTAFQHCATSSERAKKLGVVSAGPPDPTDCDLVCNATPMGMEDDDPLPVDTALLTASMFVGDVIAGHGVTLLIKAAESAGCKTANGGHMVEAAQDVMADFMLQKDNGSAE
jgi:shikimate 5-dehydrogenase